MDQDDTARKMLIKRETKPERPLDNKPAIKHLTGSTDFFYFNQPCRESQEKDGNGSCP
jgi:hypothetical protein